MPWLSDSEMEALTKRKKPTAQMRVLAEAGIPFKVVAGRPVVVHDALYEEMPRRSRPFAPDVLEGGKLLAR